MKTNTTKQTINGTEIEDIAAAEAYALAKMGKDAVRRFYDVAYAQHFDSLKVEYTTGK